MIVDVTGTILVPGNLGQDCPGNGEGSSECCCDECDYMLCCMEDHDMRSCITCDDPECPRVGKIFVAKK